VVSGVAGLLMSLDVERGIKPSGARIKKILLDTCVRPSSDEVEIASIHLSGRLDALMSFRIFSGSALAVGSHSTSDLSFLVCLVTAGRLCAAAHIR
jgi:hypothetical protein